jgi:hypothetical protein
MSATFILPKWNFNLSKLPRTRTRTPRFPDISKLNRLERLAGVVVTTAFLGKIPNTSTYKLDSRYFWPGLSLRTLETALFRCSEDLRHRIASTSSSSEFPQDLGQGLSEVLPKLLSRLVSRRHLVERSSEDLLPL